MEETGKRDDGKPVPLSVLIWKEMQVTNEMDILDSEIDQVWVSTIVINNTVHGRVGEDEDALDYVKDKK